MKRFWPMLLLLLVVAFVNADTASAARGGGGGGRGASSGHGGHHGSHGHGHGGHHGHSHGSHTRFAFGFFGGPWYGWPWYDPWYYGPAYRSPPPYYYGATPYYDPAPATYISSDSAAPPARPQSPAWYYCRELNGYYPYVSQCPEAWERVDPVPPPGSDNQARPQ